MTQKFFITTPIYYSNDIPHIGHAYSSFIADTYARFKRLLGYEVKFSTGVDENSQKIVQKAEEAGIPLDEYLDSFASKHIAVRDALNISYTDFIRTTGRSVVNKDKKTFQYDHQVFVQSILQQVYDKQEDIYQGEYVGLYCVGCEAFKKPTDLIEATGQYEGIPAGEKVCPDHPNRHLDQIKEKNRFFKLSKYQNFLADFYKNNPDFVIPQHRFNEVISLVTSGVEDFSISREGKTFGIALPFDTNSVAYVRYDALLNYATVCENTDFTRKKGNEVERVHVLGKDISRFHAVYRPAMLESAGLPLPNKEIVTGFFTVDGQKMSKSIGNVVNPVEVIEKYGRDALVFYLLYDIPIGSDGDYSNERFVNTYNGVLLGGRGNLVSRVTNIAAKNEITNVEVTEDMIQNFKAHHFAYDNDTTKLNEMPAILNYISHTPSDLSYFNEFYLNNGNLQKYLQDWYRIVQSANSYMQNEQPRTKLKEESTKEEGIKDLQFLLYVIKNLALLSAPILAQGFARVQEILCNPELSAITTATSLDPEQFQKALDMTEFPVNLTPGILYNRVE